MRTAIKTLCSLIFVLALTAGCGQKGPLFLPGDPATVQTEVAGQGQFEATPNESDEDKEDEDDQQ